MPCRRGGTRCPLAPCCLPAPLLVSVIHTTALSHTLSTRDSCSFTSFIHSKPVYTTEPLPWERHCAGLCGRHRNSLPVDPASRSLQGGGRSLGIRVTTVHIKRRHVHTWPYILSRGNATFRASHTYFIYSPPHPSQLGRRDSTEGP